MEPKTTLAYTPWQPNSKWHGVRFKKNGPSSAWETPAPTVTEKIYLIANALRQTLKLSEVAPASVKLVPSRLTKL